MAYRLVYGAFSSLLEDPDHHGHPAPDPGFSRKQTEQARKPRSSKVFASVPASSQVHAFCPGFPG